MNEKCIEQMKDLFLKEDTDIEVYVYDGISTIKPKMRFDVTYIDEDALKKEFSLFTRE